MELHNSSPETVLVSSYAGWQMMMTTSIGKAEVTVIIRKNGFRK